MTKKTLTCAVATLVLVGAAVASVSSAQADRRGDASMAASMAGIASHRAAALAGRVVTAAATATVPARPTTVCAPLPTAATSGSSGAAFRPTPPTETTHLGEGAGGPHPRARVGSEPAGWRGGSLLSRAVAA